MQSIEESVKTWFHFVEHVFGKNKPNPVFIFFVLLLWVGSTLITINSGSLSTWKELEPPEKVYVPSFWVQITQNYGEHALLILFNTLLIHFAIYEKYDWMSIQKHQTLLRFVLVLPIVIYITFCHEFGYKEYSLVSEWWVDFSDPHATFTCFSWVAMLTLTSSLIHTKHVFDAIEDTCIAMIHIVMMAFPIYISFSLSSEPAFSTKFFLFVCLSISIQLAFDYIVSHYTKFKSLVTTQSNSYQDNFVLIYNTFFLSFILLFQFYYLKPYNDPNWFTSKIEVSRSVGSFVIYTVFSDFFFYFIHRSQHLFPFLNQWSHRLTHHTNHTRAIEGISTDLFDFSLRIFAHFLAAQLTLLIFQTDTFVESLIRNQIIITFCLCQHYGNDMVGLSVALWTPWLGLFIYGRSSGPSYHALHYIESDCNFGLTPITDIIFGTYKEPFNISAIENKDEVHSLTKIKKDD